LKYCINKVPPSAETYLKQKVSDEREKRKIRIELLGQSVNATLFLIGGSLVLLFLLIFLATSVLHVKNVLNGNEQAIKELQSFGLMWSNVGLPLSVFTVIIFPISVCYFCLIYVAPSAEAGGMWGKWVVKCFRSSTRGKIGMSIRLTDCQS